MSEYGIKADRGPGEAGGGLAFLAPRSSAGLTVTVPREFVHRAALAEVMPIGWERLTGERFVVRAQWPRSHSLFASGPQGRYDATIVAETIRQLGLLLCHAELGVPLDHHFLMHDLTFHIEPEQLQIGATPAMLEIEVDCVETRLRSGRLSALRYTAVLMRDGEFIASGTASGTMVAPRVYQRMRGEAETRAVTPYSAVLPCAASPSEVGRTNAKDVVLAPTAEPNRWLLRVDTRHPVLFDHPVDHVPGMTLLEAARQAAVTAFGGAPLQILGMACTFTRYAELAAPCEIETCLLPRACAETQDCVLVTGRQGDAQVFSATVAVALCGLGGRLR
jgi:hypothetical protein